MDLVHSEQVELQMPSQQIEFSVASTQNEMDQKQKVKSILREKKKQLIKKVKCIILSQLLSSIVLVFVMLLFYVILRKQFEGYVNSAYLSLFIIADSLFSISWIFSLVALPFRNDMCAQIARFGHGASILSRIVGLIIGVYGILVIISVATIIGLKSLLTQWQFYPAKRWQRRFNPNLRFQDVIDHQNKLASKAENSSSDTFNDELPPQ